MDEREKDDQKVIELVPTVGRKFVKGEGYSEDGDAWLHPEVAEEEVFDNKVRVLVDRLAAKMDFPNVGNFYADSDMRRLNLIKYFRALFWLKPDWMLVGEALGIHGCVKTGIPHIGTINSGGALGPAFSRHSFCG